MAEGLQTNSELEQRERGGAGGGTADGAGSEFIPRHLFIFPWYCCTTGIELQTTFLLRSLIPHSNRGCNLTMLQLPCLKAVDETVCLCIYKEKQPPKNHTSQNSVTNSMIPDHCAAVQMPGLAQCWRGKV